MNGYQKIEAIRLLKDGAQLLRKMAAKQFKLANSKLTINLRKLKEAGRANGR